MVGNCFGLLNHTYKLSKLLRIGKNKTEKQGKLQICKLRLEIELIDTYFISYFIDKFFITNQNSRIQRLTVNSKKFRELKLNVKNSCIRNLETSLQSNKSLKNVFYV